MSTGLEKVANTIFKSWRTTLLSLALFGGLIALGITGTADWSTLSGWFPSAAMFLFVDDPGAKGREERKARRAMERAIDEPNADN